MNKVTWFMSLILLLFTLENTYADDTEIFSGGVVNVPPNVLIIFDTSGSMDDQIASSIYYPSNDYSNGLGGVGYIYDTEKVYYVWKEPSHPQEFPIYRVFTDTTAEVGCFEAGEALETLGHWMGYIENSSPFNCGTTNAETLATGNYLNFLQTPETDWDEKIDVAKQVIEDLLVSVEDTAVRFGLMRYDEVKNQGGRILAEIGSTDDQIKLQMDDNDFYPHGATPIAECLAEAGLYFAGQQSWADNSITYTSPVQWRCQKNYIILMTDGCSYADEGDAHYTKDILFTKADYLNGSPIGDYDGDTVDPQTDVNGGTHWLDDVAKFLYDEDILIDPATDNAGVSFDDEYFQQQNIVTYTIGFATGTDDLLLQRAADSNHGHGAYYSAEDSSELATAFSTIVGIILSHNASFIAPVVPVSKQNSIFSGNTVYLSLFKPMNDSGFWYGNIKKFGIDSHGLILQKNGTLATDQNGQILDDASSCWQDSSLDGSTTEAGGAGSAMLNQTTRNFYTYKSGNSYDLTSSVNAFSTGNADITAALLGVTSDHRDDLINFLTARGDYALGGQFEREWVLGDILHSKPATMYDGNNTLIFLGANDGFLHVFVDDDKGTDSTDTLGDDTLSEAWCFVPWDILPDLHLIQDSTAHHYYVDGSPMLYRAGNNQYVAFGMRRGGNKYYSINIGQYDANDDYIPDGYLSPTWVWEITPDILGSESLGQSWSKPRARTIATGVSSTNRVLLLAGGYDADNQDLASPAAGDTKGRAVYAVDAETGALSTVFNFNRSNESDMLYSIVDVISFDYNNNGLEDTVYAGSTGGNLFVFQDRDANASWEKRQLFKARDGATASVLLKFLYAPDIVMESFGDYVYIGSGDREHPSETATVNRFYAIKNQWTSPWSYLTETDLVDVTQYDYSPSTRTSLVNGNGWYIKLDQNTGEKVVSSPLVFNRTVYFTTFAPESPAEGDACAVGGLGSGRLYAVDYLTGEAAINFDTSNDSVDGEVLLQSDRCLVLGSGLPSEPTLIVTQEGAKLLIGTEGAGGTAGAKTIDLPSDNLIFRYYWKQN